MLRASNSRSAPATTTAARADDGRSRPKPPPSTSTAVIAIAATTPAACVFAPDASATSVRVLDALAGKPPNSPAPTFVAPSATISAFRVDVLGASGGEGAGKNCRVGDHDEGDARRGDDQITDLAERRVGQRGPGKSRGNRADDRDAARGEIEHAHDEGRPDDRGEHAGHPRRETCTHEDQGQRAGSERERGADGLAVGQTPHERVPCSRRNHRHRK